MEFSTSTKAVLPSPPASGATDKAAVFNKGEGMSVRDIVRFRPRTTGLAVALAAVAALAFVPPAAAHQAAATPHKSHQKTYKTRIAPGLPTPDSFGAPLPGGVAPVLGRDDAALYRRIMDVQDNGDWKTADRLIAEVKDPLLMGHVLAQRYLHPTKYRSRYKELKAWLAKYNDHPDAGRLYKIALRRRPANWRMPKTPVNSYLGGSGGNAATVAAKPRQRKPVSRAQRRHVRGYKRRIKDLLRKGWTKSAKTMIQSREARRMFSDSDMDWAKTRLAFAYFVDGRDEWALKWAGEAAARSAAQVPEANWTAGLAAWRLKKFDVAAGHFENLADQPGLSSWFASAAAFWAARANLVGGRPERVNTLLLKAFAAPRTFYGLLAGRILGEPANFRWTAPPLVASQMQSLAEKPAVRRAVALLQIGERRRAERDLRVLAARSDTSQATTILAFAARADMPALSVRLNDKMFPSGGGYDAAAFPVPGWRPKGGFIVDRALIYALARQESGFNPKAKSGAGARGLLQLMPGTASFVAGDRRFRRSKKRTLFKPEINLTLGQKYIEFLLNDKKIGGDLFRLAAAWNGGPGNLNKWRRRVDDLGDPLFFIESLPSRETRIFIERVMANLWIYRFRLDQAAPSLDLLAAGDWPVYQALEGDALQVARNE